MFTEEERWAMTLSTFAGLSTTIGAAFAVIKKPDDALLAFLLGTAIGVMALLSVVEMWLHNAMQHGWPGVTAAVLAGALLYQLVQPFLPDFKPEEALGDAGSDQFTSSHDGDMAAAVDAATAVLGGALERSNSDTVAAKERKKTGTRATESSASPQRTRLSKNARLRSSELLRLGLLMAFTMTLHNLPEGFAVAFAAFTDFGPVMAAAIAVHNIPEGVIVAAPVYAATGSRWKALAVATASGLSEPLGAFLALVAVKPMLNEDMLHYMLAFAGGIMVAVCALELWPEGRKCRADRRLAAGIALGVMVMGWTLWVGV